MNEQSAARTSPGRARLPRGPLCLVILSALVVALALLVVGPVAGVAQAQEGPQGANVPAAPGTGPGGSDNNDGGGGGGGGAGWTPLISTLQGFVPIAGAIGLLIGIAIWGSAGPNTAQKATGLGVMGTAVLGLVIGSFAADLAALFTQFI